MSVEHFISLEKAEIAMLTSQLDELGDLLNQSKGDLALLLTSTAPPPIGTAADVVSLGVSIGRGDWGGAFWDVIGLVPVVGDGIKGAVKGTKLAKKIANITAKIAKARKKIADRTKNIRKNAQKKCDKLVKNSKKRKPDKKAATDCGTNCGGVKNAADFPEVASKISQKQLRHVGGRPEHAARGGGYLDSVDDAQAVLDSYKSGSGTIIGESSQGFPIVRVDGVTGTNVNVGAGIENQATNIFMIKGTAKPSVVPVNPNWKPK